MKAEEKKPGQISDEDLLAELGSKTEVAPGKKMRYGFLVSAGVLAEFDKWIARHKVDSRAAALRWFIKWACKHDMDPRSI